MQFVPSLRRLIPWLWRRNNNVKWENTLHLTSLMPWTWVTKRTSLLAHPPRATPKYKRPTLPNKLLKKATHADLSFAPIVRIPPIWLIDVSSYMAFRLGTKFMANMLSYPINQRNHPRQIKHNPLHYMPKKVSNFSLRSTLNSSLCFVKCLSFMPSRPHHPQILGYLIVEPSITLRLLPGYLLLPHSTPLLILLMDLMQESVALVPYLWFQIYLLMKFFVCLPFMLIYFLVANLHLVLIFLFNSLLPFVS